MQNPRLSWADRLFRPLLFILTLTSLLVRVLPLYDRVITPDAVRFQGIDAYYHVRLSKYVTEHFPHRLEFDSLRLHPGGQRVDVYPAYDLVNASLALTAGLGSPSERTTEEAIAWSPPLLGAVTVTFIGLAARVFAGPWGGLAAASVAGFLPGGTLTQTELGLSDHHALETFFLAVAWWILSLLLRPEGSVRRRLLMAAALGATAGGYALTWEGSPILPTVIGLCTAALILMHAADGMVQRRIAAEAAVVTVIALAVAWSAQFWSPMITVSVTLLLLGALLPLVMVLLHRALGPDSVRRLRIAWLFAVLAVAAGITLLLPSSLSSSLVTNLGRFDPSDKARTVSELRPLFNEPDILWSYYGLSLVWAAAGLVVAFVTLMRRREEAFLVPLVTGLLFIPSALLQIRFASAASLPLALLSAVVVGGLVHRSSVADRWSKRTAVFIRGSILAAWLVTVLLWSSWNAPRVAGVDRGPSPDWLSVTSWLKGHTPELDTVSTVEGKSIVRRTGVLNWWDSGYYLTTLAGKVPVSNPSQAGARQAADAYLDTTGERGVAGLAQEAIRYIIVEAALALHPTSETSIGGQFPALPVWAGKDRRSFVREVYFPQANGRLEPRYAYLPAYYRTLLIRLLLTDGEKRMPASRAAWAIQLEPQGVSSGHTIDVVRSSRSFGSAEAAGSFLRYEADSTWLIVGFSPFEPCVPLNAVRNVRLVHASPGIAFSVPSLPRPIPVLKVYEIAGAE